MRKARTLQANATYHILARANQGLQLEDDPTVETMFLEVIKRAQDRFDFQLDNFALMGNQFHFDIKPGTEACLSSIMKWILQVFASRYNRANHVIGHFWGSRFLSEPVHEP